MPNGASPYLVIWEPLLLPFPGVEEEEGNEAKEEVRKRGPLQDRASSVLAHQPPPSCFFHLLLPFIIQRVDWTGGAEDGGGDGFSHNLLSEATTSGSHIGWASSEWFYKAATGVAIKEDLGQSNKVGRKQGSLGWNA